MKVYVLVNSYMIGIQAGIQALHAVSDMWSRTTNSPESRLRAWEKDHKTVILLNGGGQPQLEEYLNTISSLTSDWGTAREDVGLNFALTAVAFVSDPENLKFQELMGQVQLLPLKS